LDASSGLALPTLLSHALVAFTVEFDNEAEHLMVHHTSTRSHGAPGGGPWLVSQVMWVNVMRHVRHDGITIGELHARSRTTKDSLAGLQRWGYVTVGPGPDDVRPTPPRRDLVVRPTARGRHAQEVWTPFGPVIERRWVTRFGERPVAILRGSLLAVLGQIDPALPLYLPIVSPTQNGRAEVPAGATAPGGVGTEESDTLDLSALLAQVLLAFTLDYEQVSVLSLPISANSLRVLDQHGVRVRELPTLTGVSKEANAMAVGFLERHKCAVTEPAPGASRGQMVRLTDRGAKAQAKYRRNLRSTEERWRSRFGAPTIDHLRHALETVVHGPLLEGLEPYPDGWRASVRLPATLPHYPMVLHRGGYPDGS
jgi:DNA-binding MarR family transcriptional regulator